jgi:peptidoglycan/LPS O-acetylase OafA/YrhL
MAPYADDVVRQPGFEWSRRMPGFRRITAAEGTTLASLFTRAPNSLNFVRWLMAALVVVDHTFPIAGLNGGEDPTWAWSRGQDSLGGIAVAAFFVISGFLVTRSWQTSRGVVRFVWRRGIRIFPGYWLCLVVTACVFAPLAWHHERGGWTGVFRVDQDSPWSYVTENLWLQLNQLNIAGLLHDTPFADSPFAVAWNGSLWTLIYEFKCYLLLALLGFAGLLRSWKAVAVIAGVSYLLMLSTLVDPTWGGRLLPMLSDVSWSRFLFMFFLGSTMAFFADRIEVSWRLAAVCLVVVVYSLHRGGWALVGLPALAYLVLWAGVALPCLWFNRLGDISYGTYIWAFPIQMLLAQHDMQAHGTAAFVLSSLAFTTAAALVSWHLFEKQAMKLKSWDPLATARSRRARRDRVPPASPVGAGEREPSLQ